MHHIDDPAYMTPFDKLRAFGPKRERARSQPRTSSQDGLICRKT